MKNCQSQQIRSKPPFLFFSTLFMVAILFGPLSHKLSAQTSYTWNGSNSSAWNDNLNWTPNAGFPGTTDSVTIVLAGFTPVLDGIHTVNNFTINSGSLDLNNFTLNISSISTFTNGSINNGTIMPAGTSATFSGTTFGAIVSASCNTISLNGSVFNNTATFTKNGAVSNNCIGGNTFNGITKIVTNGGGNIFLSNVTRDIFNGDITFSSSSGIIYPANNDATGTQFNGHIIVNSTGTSGGIHFCQGSGTATLANTKTISIGVSGFSTGTLYLPKFTQVGATPQTLSLSGTALLQLGPSAVFNGNVIFVSPQLLLNGTTFNGTTSLTKNGATINTSTGGNIFNGVTTLKCSGSGSFELGNTLPEKFNTDLTITNTGTSRIQIGISSVGNLFNGNTTINYGGNTASLNIVIARNPGSTAIFNGNLVLNCTNLNATSGIIISNEGTVNINGNVTVSSTSGRGILFSDVGGSVTLGNGFTISDAGAGSFTTGTLKLFRFTQTGATAQNITLSGTANLQIGALAKFNGAVNFTAPQLFLNGGQFNNTAVLTKNGAVDNTSTGGNTFNNTTIITNSGSGMLDLAQTTADDYNGNVTFTQTGSARISPFIAGSSTFAGNISTMGSNAQISFGYTWSTGKMIIDGAGIQNFYGDTAHPPIVKALTITKSGGSLTLGVNVTVLTDIAFISGIINSTTTNSTSPGLLILNNGITMSNLADNGSYVNGYVCKIGNSAFTFPVGNDNFYAPISISAPSVSTDHFTAKYVHVNTHSLYDTTLRDPSLDHISGCEYWMLDRTGGTSNVSVSLNWGPESGGITNLSNLRVARWNGSIWRDHGNGGTTGTIASGKISTSVSVSSFSPFTLASATLENPLPIELTSFTAQCEDGQSIIKWSTASETNNDYFTIEHSKDGIDWGSIGTIKGAGNSSINVHYSLIDENNHMDSYYRLKQTDFDGEDEYLNIIIFLKNCVETLIEGNIKIYPNPTESIVKIDTQEKITSILVFNLNGQLINTMNIDTHNKTIDFSLSQEGIYTIEITTPTRIIHKKAIVSRH